MTSRQRSTRAERAAARRRAVRRRRAVALGVLIASVLGVFALAGPGGGGTTKHPQLRHAVVAAVRRPSVVAVHQPPGPGSLPQTTALPSADTPLFKQLMRDLWTGVVENRLSPALPAFFPLRAYLQLKSIADAATDWRGRLVHDYRLDIAAAHGLLGANAPGAQLVKVTVVSSYAHWVPPGVCDNGVGYFEMPNARVVYTMAGQVRSFGIASLISWRGVWYVVHFGAILRATDVGQVADPASGPGQSVYSGTC